MVVTQQYEYAKCYSVVHFKMLILYYVNFTTPKKLRIYVHQKTPLRKQKGKPQTGRKYLELTFLTKDLCQEYIKNYNSISKTR